MKNKKIKLASILTASALLLSGCSSILDSSYLGYKKNEIKYGKGVTKQFQQAVYNSNIEWLEEILTKYPDYNVNYFGNNEIKYNGYDHETLKVICVNGLFNYVAEDKMLRYLLGNGLDPNLKFSNGYYALDLLCADYNFRPFLVKTLLEYGADPNNANTAGFYNVNLGDSNKEDPLLPIFWGIYKPAYTNAKDLLEHGATVTYEMLDDIHNKRTTFNGSAKAYQLAYKSYIEKTGETPFTKAEEYAILGESDKLIEELKNGEELDDITAVNVRYFICRFCNASSMKAWDEVYSEREISEYDYEKMHIWDQLFSAVYEGNYEIVEYLFEGIDESYTINDALESAAQVGNYDMCKFLLENGFFEEDIFAQMKYKDIIRAAFLSNDIDTFKFIADFFKNKNVLTDAELVWVFDDLKVEWSPFTKEAIDYLMDECGLQMTGIDSQYVDFDTIKYLFEKGKPLSVFDLPNAVCLRDVQAVEYILNKGADPNQDLYSIYYYDTTEKFLMPYREVLAEFGSGNSECIKHAVRYGTSEIVQMFIDHGADLSDESILACAITDSSKATFDILFNAGASLDYRNDKYEETLVDLAQSMGRDDIVKILKKAGVKAYKGI